MAKRSNLKPKIVEKHRNPNVTQDRLTVRTEAKKYVNSFINDLTPPIISELLEGYENDFHALLTSIQEETERVIYNIPDYRFSKNAAFNLDNVFNGFDEALKRHSYNYFKTTMLTDFDMGWRNIEWGNILTKYPWHVTKASRSSGKCFAPETPVLMFDGSIKAIKDIKVGDLLMGKDNEPRTVLKLHNGIDDMYEVEQKQSLNYTVNSKHDLYLKKWRTISFKNELGKNCAKTIYDENDAPDLKITAPEFITKSKWFRENSIGLKVEGWELPKKELKIEPYYLGLWLGDGTNINTDITSIDEEVVCYLREYAKRLQMIFRSYKSKQSKGKYIIHKIMSYEKGQKPIENKLKSYLNYYNLLKNKHIPEIYIKSSRVDRLQLLAGLIDSDGTAPKGKLKTYVFTQKSDSLMKQVQLLCWSLGFRANISEHTYKTKSTKSGKATTRHLYISGDVYKIPCKIPRKKKEKYDKVSKPTTRCGINVNYVGKGEYFGFTCDKDHLFLLADGTIVSNSFEYCYSYPLFRIWRYRKPTELNPDTIDNRNSKDVCIITNESKLGKIHLEKIAQQITDNDKLHEQLMFTWGKKKSEALGKEVIKGANGSSIVLRSRQSKAIRGLHVGTVLVDDFLDKSAIYSAEQRESFKETFYGDIMSIVEPGGVLAVSGTPFSHIDLYNDLSSDPKFKVFSYPAIYPNGKLLAPDRFGYEELLARRESMGSVVFSREMLVIPISDSSTFFPFEWLMSSIRDMENISYVENKESYPIKMKKVIAGCDFAKSANIGADYTVYTVWGLGFDDRYYLMYMWRKRGASINEQVSRLLSIDERFKPNKMVCEVNGFQGTIVDMAKQRGLKNLVEFTTTAEVKRNLLEGLLSLSPMFERGEIRTPYKEGISKEQTDILHGEFNSITIDEDKGKVGSVLGHDDICMSSFFAITYLRENKGGFKIHLI